MTTKQNPIFPTSRVDKNQEFCRPYFLSNTGIIFNHFI